MLRLRDQIWPGEVDWVSNGVEESVPSLSDAIIGHLQGDERGVLIR